MKMGSHRFIVFSEDPFRIHDDDRQAFRIPAPYAGEIVDLLKREGYQVEEITFEGIYSGKLNPEEWDTFVMPYGGLYPKGGWEMIRSYLEGGGNLLTIGGPPFSRAFEKKGKVWPCDPYSPEIINGQLRLRWYEVGGFTYLEANDDWKKILGFDRIRCLEPGVGIEAGAYLPDLEERCRDVEPILAYTDRFGTIKGYGALLIKNYSKPFANSLWICVGSLSSLTNPQWPDAVSGLARYLSREASLRKVNTDKVVYKVGEQPKLIGEVLSRYKKEKLRIEVQLYGTEQLSPAKTINRLIDRGEFSILFDQSGLQDDFYTVKVKLLDSKGMLIDVAETGLVLLDNLKQKGYVERRLRNGVFQSIGSENKPSGSQSALLLGGNYFLTATGLNIYANPSALSWHRDIQAMRDYGMTSARIFIPRRLLTRDEELDPQRVESHGAIVHFLLKNGITPFICAHSAHTFPGRDPRCDRQIRPKQKEWTKFWVQRYGPLPVLWDLENEDGVSRLARRTRDNYSIFEPAPFLEEEWNRWLEERFSPEERKQLLGKREHFALPDIHNQRFDDPLERSWRLFAAERFREWMEEMREAIKEVASETPITYGHWHDAFYEIYDRPNRETNGDLLFTHPPLDFTCIHCYWDQFDKHGNHILQDPMTLLKYGGVEVLGKPIVVGETAILSEEVADEDRYATFVEDWCYALLGSGAQGLSIWTWESHLSTMGERGGELLRLDKTPRKALKRFRDFALLTKQVNFLPEKAEAFLVVSLAAKIGGEPDKYVRAITEAIHQMYATGARFQVIADQDLDQLPEQAKLLIIPSPLCMEENSWQRIKTFLEKGGYAYISGDFNRDEWRRKTHNRLEDILGRNARGLSEKKLQRFRAPVGQGELLFLTQPVEYLRGQISTRVRKKEEFDAIEPPSPLPIYLELLERAQIPRVKTDPEDSDLWVIKRDTSGGALYVVRDLTGCPEVSFEGLRLVSDKYALVEKGPEGVLLFEGRQLSAEKQFVSVSSGARGLVFSVDKKPIACSSALAIKFKQEGKVRIRTQITWKRPTLAILHLDHRGITILSQEELKVSCSLITLDISEELSDYLWLVAEQKELSKQVRVLEQRWLT